MDSAKRVLLQLATFKFLAISQFKMLERPQSSKSLYSTLQMLKEKGFVHANSYKYHPKYWKLENLYYLNPKATRYLTEVLCMKPIDIKLPINHKGFYNDYQHRKMTINCHISLYNSLETTDSLTNSFIMWGTLSLIYCFTQKKSCQNYKISWKAPVKVLVSLSKKVITAWKI